jgi:hypothetical protein
MGFFDMLDNLLMGLFAFFDDARLDDFLMV